MPSSWINVIDFGADPTGANDSAQAFIDAIASFGPANDSFAGTVVAPVGTFRFASSVRIKKSVLIKGSQSASTRQSTTIVPDAGIEAFVFERYNTPTGTTSAGAGDGAQIQSLVVNPAAKVANWEGAHPYVVGDKIRTGTGIGEDWRRHYICRAGGTSASSGFGPRSLGNDEILNFDGQMAQFTLHRYISGETSGATGLVIAVVSSGVSGQLRLTSVSGVFQDNENLKIKDVICAVADGQSTAATDFESDGTVRWEYLGCGAGIKIRANGCTLRDVTVLYASGNGVHIEAQDPEVPSAIANANSWHLDNVNIWHSDGHGLYLNGSDSNGGSYIHGVMYGNGSPTSDEDFTGTGYNIYDSSFLGKTYVAIQMGSGGSGSIYCDSVGGGSTFIGCYQEGTGGGENVVSGNCVIVGGGLSASIFEPGSYPVTLGPVASSRGQCHAVTGYSGAPWRPKVAVKGGNRRVTDRRLYQVIAAGITATGGGPTSTGTDIIDGTAHWSYVHDTTNNGLITFGSVDPQYKTFFTAQAPDDVLTGLATYYRHDNFGGCNDVQGFQYGISGTGRNDSGAGLMHAVNKSTLNEWPMHIPAGGALFETLWIGGRRITASTSTKPPGAGTWNPGDRIYFKEPAAVPGGAEGLECVMHGTAGTYLGGRTATADGSRKIIISGQEMGTLFDQHDFKIGDRLTINGVAGRVMDVSDNGLSLTMEFAVGAGAGLGIKFAAPMFKEFGRIAGGAGDSTVTPGNATLSTQKGRSAIARGDTTVTIKNNRVTTSSVVHATLQTIDATLTQILCVVPGAGGFDIVGNAAATAPVNVCWSIEE